MEARQFIDSNKLPELCFKVDRPKLALWRLQTASPLSPLSLKALKLAPHRASGAIRSQAADQPRSRFAPEGLLPQAEFYKVEAILRPWRLSHVASGLLTVGIRGVTVSDVRGFGAQGGARERQAGSEFGADSFVSKVKLEVVVSKDQVDAVVNTIIDQARTGEIGDGKIFVVPVADVIRVRTGERGIKAERMAGGRADLLNGKLPS